MMQVEVTDALLVVDVQKDFCPGGALGVADGDAVVPIINSLLSKFQHVVFTRDWHPANHCSFSEEARFVDGSWPVHCVAGTEGAAFHEELVRPESAMIVNKATDAEKEVYSGFEDTQLAEALRDRGVTRVVVCGLATDYCVKATALDGLEEGFEVVVVRDACRAVDNPMGSGEGAIAEM